MTQFNDVEAFHNKFGLSNEGRPISLTTAERKFRVKCLYEELHEYEDALEEGNLAEQFDALIDLVYFALGTAHRQGFPFDHGFDLVHQANMSKEQNPDNQRRGYALEITKPEGWKPPDLQELLLDHHTFKQINSGYSGLITVDGVDGSGKTTLAKRIAQLFGGEYIHLTWTPQLERVMSQYRMGAIEYAIALSTDRVVVLERPWLSHPIYSTVYRGAVMSDYRPWRMRTEQSQCLGIMALPEDKDVWLHDFKRSTETRAELYPDLTLIGQTYDKFLAAWEGEQTDSLLTPRLDNTAYVRYDYQAVNPVDQLDNWIMTNFNQYARGDSND